MKLFNFLSGNKKQTVTEETITPRIECDINKTQALVPLLQVPREQRDEQWQQQFLQLIQHASMEAGDPEVQTGPDGFPYFVLRTPVPGRAFESFCIHNMMNDLLLEKGYGVVLNPSGEAADWVFSNGDIVNLAINGEFYSAPDQSNPAYIEMTQQMGVIQKNDKVLLAQPSPRFLPVKTRTAIREFLKRNGIKRPMVMLLSRTSEGRAVQQLVFNVFAEDLSSPEQVGMIMQSLTWFLPRHYAILSINKQSPMVKSFADL
jgi:hypothetical protein